MITLDVGGDANISKKNKPRMLRGLNIIQKKLNYAFAVFLGRPTALISAFASFAFFTKKRCFS